MSLDIGFQDAKSATLELLAPSRLAFDDNGYYWFCYPYFEELARHTSQMIDLYGNARFDSELLNELDATVTQITEKVRSMPATWNVAVGHSIGTVSAPTEPIPIYSSVSRDELLSLLSRFAEVIAEAKRNRYSVVCMGD